MAKSNPLIPTVNIVLQEPVNGLVVQGIVEGAPPTGAAYAGIFSLECLLTDTDGAGLYEQTGTVAVPAWTLLGAGALGITQLTGDVTAGPGAGAQVASIAAGVIVNADINNSAAIAFSKLEPMVAGTIIVGSVGTVATERAVTGDVSLSATGVTAISAGVIVNADINNSAAIAFSKLATLTSGNILVGSAGNVATSVAASGDATISNAGVVTLTNYKVAQVSLTNAQILNLNSTPITIVDASALGLSASQVIMPIKATMAYTWAVADYATNTDITLIHSGSTIAMLWTSVAGLGQSTFTPFVNNDSVIIAGSGNIFIANADLNVFVPTGNPTGGNAGSSMIITVFYTIMDAI